jgi:hypothetical protein
MGKGRVLGHTPRSSPGGKDFFLVIYLRKIPEETGESVGEKKK